MRAAARAAVAGLVLAAGVLAGPAAAQDLDDQQEPPGPPAPKPQITEEESAVWRGSRFRAPLEEGTHRTAEPALRVAGEFRYVRRQDVRVALRVEPVHGLADGCRHDDPPELRTEGAEFDPPTSRMRYRFEVPFELTCNGTYVVVATAKVYEQNVADPVMTSPDLVAHLHVAAPPPSVPAVRVASEGDAVVIAWDPPELLPADHAGYQVDRVDPGGSSTTIARTGPGETRATDAAPPSPREGTTYRVVALRPGPDGETLVSPTPAEATVPAGPAPGEGPDAGPGGNAATERVPRAPGRRIALPPRSSRSPIAPFPAGGRPSASAAPTATEVDEGYEDDLPYEDREPGHRDAVLPEDAALLYGDGVDGAEILTPFAIALLLAVWGGHLRYVTRLSRQTA